MNFANLLTIIFIILFCSSFLVKLFLDIVNYKYRKKYSNKIPKELVDVVDKEKLELINKYSNSKLIFSLIQYILDKVFLLLILFLSIIPYYYTTFIKDKFNSIYLTAGVFFLIILLVQTIYSLQFSFIFNFVIEKKYGFNKMTIPMWIIDIIKHFVISIVLFGIILFALIFFLYTPMLKNIWWILLWAFFVIFSFVMQIVYPAIIAPLFNKFKQLENDELKEKIENLVRETGLKSNGVFEMDASKRSTHSNAYFSGIGKSKRIILFDSLLKNHTNDEILAILAHELGHYKHKHVIKTIITSFGIAFILLFISYLFIENKMLYDAFGFSKSIPIESIKFIGILLLSFIGSPIFFLSTPIGSMISRKHEYQADEYSKKAIGNSEPLINALKKLTVNNLSNIYPSPLYSWFYYSHPPLFQRIRALKK